jgi:NAD(P)-dependent dehydrogenase (short-subunit alcohol dehydrogenase family)
MRQVIVVTGGSSGFGRMIAVDLAKAGHIVYASMRGTTGKNAATMQDIKREAQDNHIDLRTIELDVQDEASIGQAIKTIIDEHGRIDVLVQNAGHMVFGPLEAFTPEQLAAIYDINVIGTHRVNRAVLPHMRAARSGLILWISSSSVAGGVPPLLGPYFAAKAGMDALAVCYAKEIAPFGIETSIIVPGAFTTGTNHFANSGTPADKSVAADYADNLPADFAERVKEALSRTVPPDANPAEVASAAVIVVSHPRGTRPLRTYVDPASDGAAVTFTVMDRVREQFMDRIGFPELLHPASSQGEPAR